MGERFLRPAGLSAWPGIVDDGSGRWDSTPRRPPPPPPTLPPRGRPQPTARPRRPVCLSRLTTDLRRGPRPPAPLSLAGPRGCLMPRGGWVPDKHDVSRNPPPCFRRRVSGPRRAETEPRPFRPAARQAIGPELQTPPAGGGWSVVGGGGCFCCTWCDLAALPPPPPPLPATPLRGYLVDPASSICLSQRLSHASLSTHGRYSETANGSLNQLWFL